MSIKPVFFNREMVKAVLDGKKTVMRVPVKCRGYKVGDPPSWAKRWSGPDHFFEVSRLDASEEDGSEIKELHSPYQPEDILWVKEPWVKIAGEYIYAADDFSFYPSGGWKSQILMPKDAVRLFLCVKTVDVGSLKRMTEQDALKEGIEPEYRIKIPDPALQRFANEWDRKFSKDLNTYGWDADPWVWVVEFERCDKPGDWMY